MTRDELFALINPLLLSHGEAFRKVARDSIKDDDTYIRVICSAATEYKRMEQEIIEILVLEQAYAGPIRRKPK